MPSIKPGNYDPSKPDIELFDYKSKKRYGLKLEGAGALQIGTISQDDSVLVRSAGKRIGDFDEQRSWKGGRGIEDLSSNAEAYWDSMNAWTMTDGHLHQTPLWQFAKGLRSADFYMPDRTRSLAWRQLLGVSKYMSISWTSAGFAADYARLWIRRVGTPGALTFTLCSNNAGVPGTVLQTVTVTTADVTDYVSVLRIFDWSGTQTLSASTTYHISVHGYTDDNKNNHWEVGGYAGGLLGQLSSNGSSNGWSSAAFDMFYYVADADISRTFFSFFLDEAMYVVDKKDDGITNSKLYINGDRGKATSAAANTLVQSTKSWVSNRWVGARVKIVRGTGAGQTREISSNTATALTVTVNWAVAPNTDSEYIIYATDWFTEISTTGLGIVSSTPAVVNQIVYFPQGAFDFIRNMVWNPTTVAHAFADETGTLDFMIKAIDSSGATRIYGTVVANFYYSAAVPWSVTPTALTYLGGSSVGDTTRVVTGMCEKDGLVYVFKQDGLWAISTSNVLIKIQNGMEKVPSAANGRSSIVHQQFMFYSWGHSLIRMYGSNHDDIGQDWKGWGLPDGREGEFSSLDSYVSLMIAAVDAGTGTSSVLGFDGVGWHEMIRAYDSNKRIRLVKVQPCQDTRNRMWTDIGGDLVYQEVPFQKGSPRLDSGMRYMHEAVIESCSIDMGTASGLPKFIKELTVSSRNLGNGNEIYVDYQTDDNVHTNNWIPATALYESPESSAFLGLSNIRRFAYRLRICSSNNTLPVDIDGVVPNGYARSPYKMIWSIRCRADNVISKGKIVKPDMLMRWLLDNARFPGRVEMRSQYELAHKFFVIIHPPRMFPYKPAQNGQAEESVFTVVLEEA